MSHSDGFGKNEKTVDTFRVTENLGSLALLLASKAQAHVVADGLLDGGEYPLHAAKGGLFLGFQGNDDALLKLEEQFNDMRRKFNDDRLPSEFRMIRYESSASNKIVFVDISPLLAAPDLLSKIAALESRRGALKVIGVGSLVTLSGLGIECDALIAKRPIPPEAKLAETTVGILLGGAGVGMVKNGLSRYAAPTMETVARRLGKPNDLGFHLAMNMKLNEHYTRQGYTIAAITHDTTSPS